MSNEIKNIGVKVPVELYETVKEYADAIGVSMSDVIREAIKEKCHKVKQPSNEVEQSSNNIQQRFDDLKSEHEYLRQQHETAMATIQQMQADAESAKERSDTIILQVSQQVNQLTEQNQLLLEDLRPKKRWYHRLFAWNGA